MHACIVSLETGMILTVLGYIDPEEFPEHYYISL